MAGIYRQRHPEHTVFYRVRNRENWEDFGQTQKRNSFNGSRIISPVILPPPILNGQKGDGLILIEIIPEAYAAAYPEVRFW
jgi:hypothetical protein